MKECYGVNDWFCMMMMVKKGRERTYSNDDKGFALGLDSHSHSHSQLSYLFDSMEIGDLP